jgi:hypothetical protein
MTAEEKLAFLESENAALKAKNERVQTLRLKVTEKGGVSLYGLGRFPVTLYKKQWKALIGHSVEIVDFLEAHDAELTEKR